MKIKKWVIYHNNNKIGQADKMNEAFKHIEQLEGKKLTGWEISVGQIKVDNYVAKREEIE